MLIFSVLCLLPSALTLVIPQTKVIERGTTSRLSRPCPYTNFQQSTDQTKLGNLRVPSLGIGTIMWNPDTPEDEALFQDIADLAIESGLTLFDTAERYGASGKDLIPASLSALSGSEAQYVGGDCESRLAQLTKGAGTVATKFTPVPWRRDATSVVEACKASAARLGVESLDLYQIHMPDIVQPFKSLGFEDVKDEKYWDGLAECYLSGLAKNVGVSNYGPTLVARAQEALAKRGVPLASNQINYSLLYRKQGSQATVDKCNELGIKVLAYYPLAMGLLTGKFDAQNPMPGKKGRELRKYLQGGMEGIPTGGVQPLTDVLRQIANARGKTVAQVALNWVMCKGVIPLGGASKPQHIQDNLGALGWRLTTAEVAMLEETADKLGFDFGGTTFKTCDSKFVGYGYEKWTLD